MRYEFAKIDGLSTLFETREDFDLCVFKPEVENELDINTTIYITCTSEDASIFGNQFVTGSTWILTHGNLYGDMGAEATLKGYRKAEISSDIQPSDTIKVALGKLEKKAGLGADALTNEELDEICQ